MMKIKMQALIMLAGVFFFNHIAWGNEHESGVQEADMGRIEVTAMGDESADSIKADTVIPSRRMEAPVISGTILDAMAGEAGIQRVRSGVSGSKQTGIRIRGFDEKRLRLYVDGIPMEKNGSRSYGPISWESIPKEWVDHIEIVRGPGGARYGNALGGIVNLVTVKPSEEPVTTFTTLYGSMDTMDSSLSHAMKKGPLGWRFSVGYYNTDGYLRNNDFERKNISGQFFLDLPLGCAFTAGADYTDATTGMIVYNRLNSPYYDSSEPDSNESEVVGPFISMLLKNGVMGWGDGSEVEDSRLTLTARLSKTFDRGRAALSGRFIREKAHTYFYAPDDGRLIYERDGVQEDGSYLINGMVVATLAGHTVEAGGEFSRVGLGDADSTILDETTFKNPLVLKENYLGHWHGYDDFIRYEALYVTDEWSYNEYLTFRGGLRGNFFESEEFDFEESGKAKVSPALDDNSLDPRFSLAITPWSGGVLDLSVNRVHRYPRMIEYIGRYWLDGEVPGAYDDLAPEKAMHYEISFTQNMPDILSLAVRAYHFDIGDYIVSTLIPMKGRFTYNIGNVAVAGSEVEVSYNPLSDLVLWANATFQHGEKEGDALDPENEAASALADFPDTMVNVGTDYRFMDKACLSLSMKYTGSRKHVAGPNTIETLSSYTLLDLSLNWDIVNNRHMNLALTASASNLLDEDYEEVDGYPMPGTTVLAGIRAEF